MGGLGSGRRDQSGRDVTEASRPLDIRKLHRAGVLRPGRWFGWQWTVNERVVAEIQVRVEVWRVVLAYRHRRHGDAAWQDVEQPIRLDHTACTYGGMRTWWLCPSCARRVAILYGAGKLYACRHCYQLAYSCQRETTDDRAARRADTIRRRLGWEPGILNGDGGKPERMRWRTFERLTARHQALVGESLAAMAKRFGLRGSDLGGVEA